MSDAGEVIWRRIGYMLSPQLDIYQHLAPKLAGKKVLDIGFGTGFGTLQLTRHAKSVDGIELDRLAVDFAQRCIPGVRWAWGDVSRSIRYLGNGYDAAVMFEVLEHISDWRSALKNVCEVLNDEGTFIISARNANADLRKNDLHEREWMASEFVAALREFFEDVKLFDYTLTREQDISTRMTPLVAVCGGKFR